MDRLANGAIAGVVATFCMTVAMRHLFRQLPEEDRYPLPPREITQRVLGGSRRMTNEGRLREASLASHFAYGAITGSAFALWQRHRAIDGALYGLAVWWGSYLGWLPLAGILKPATRHPFRRNLLMLAAHAVWGIAVAAVLREIEKSTRAVFGSDRALLDQGAPDHMPDITPPKQRQ